MVMQRDLFICTRDFGAISKGLHGGTLLNTIAPVNLTVSSILRPAYSRERAIPSVYACEEKLVPALLAERRSS